MESVIWNDADICQRIGQGGDVSWLGLVCAGAAVGVSVAGGLIFFASLHQLHFQPTLQLGVVQIGFDSQVAFWLGMAAASLGAAIAFVIYLHERQDW